MSTENERPLEGTEDEPPLVATVGMHETVRAQVAQWLEDQTSMTMTRFPGETNQWIVVPKPLPGKHGRAKSAG